jgi:hypothetical protein
MAMLTGLATTAAGAAPPLDTAVSNRLPAPEQALLRFYIGQMSPRTQARIAAHAPLQVHIGVVDAMTHQVHVNQPDDAGSLSYTAGGGPPFRPPPASCFDPSYYGGTGPYRRVYTGCLPPVPSAFAPLSGQGYFTQGTVTTPCKAQTVKTGAGDSGFAYLGGWSGAPTEKWGNLDAGLQYNYNVTKAGGTDQYAPFISIYGHPEGHTYVSTRYFRFACGAGTTVALTFLVYGCYKAADPTSPAGPTTCLELDAESQPPAEPKFDAVVFPIPITAPQAAGPLPGGWGDLLSVTSNGQTYLVPEAPCNQCIMKWMITIAQRKPGNYTDGAAYTASWSNRAISCRAFGCTGDNEPMPLTTALVNCSEYPLWYGTYSKTNQKRDCTNTPPNQTGKAQDVQVSGYGPTGETVAISLSHGP